MFMLFYTLAFLVVVGPLVLISLVIAKDAPWRTLQMAEKKPIKSE